MNVFPDMETSRRAIRYSFALAAYADEWANAIEEGRSAGRREELPSLSGCEILDMVSASKMPRDYLTFAEETIRAVEKANKMGIVAIAYLLIGEREYNPLLSSSADKFGHYLYMSSVGHGVGLSDEFGEMADTIKIPYTCGPLAIVADNVAEYLD